MTNKNLKILTSLTIAGAVFGLVAFVSASRATREVPEPTARKIIVFKKDISDQDKNTILAKVQVQRIKHLELAKSSVALLNSEAVRELSKDSNVLRIDDDVIIEALKKPDSNNWKPTPIQSVQVIPWGIHQINADSAWQTTTADPIKVAIVDTGIYLSHPDLKDNIKGGASTVAYTRSYNDDNGHGTHVAGIVGALNNTIGVVGVGPKIDLYAVKVLDRNGSGYLSDVIEGLDWAIANGMQVVNMSLGTSAYNKSFEDAVKRVNTAGIVQVAAAGNSGPNDNTVIYPAKFSEVIAVSAADNTDTIASWSSRGQEIDLTAPGVSIYSTYKNTQYATLSGTSMAAPHVAGVAALVLSIPNKCDYNKDGKCSPYEVQQRLESTATDLGAIGKDILYGSGLVNAFKAVTQ